MLLLWPIAMSGCRFVIGDAALATHLETAMTGMAPDDVVIEVDVDQDGTKSTAHLRFRAYKRPTE